MKRYEAYVKDGKVVLKGAPAPDGRAVGGSSKMFARQMKGFYVIEQGGETAGCWLGAVSFRAGRQPFFSVSARRR